ncbi:MAG TPA: deoxyguanosinetriphosphate triphosphohydrolase [Kiritimatiellae bacterium]|nr:deoxyguanosinetriphosphate triphosphohydrolase [Kiritimatiellia bacterium]
MIRTREAREKWEEERLAPYAALSARSRGRQHPERPHPLRTEFQRDRDRVVHSRAFRRLEYKTQVFINGTADHYRTRMTHTIEMAAVGRTIARALGINEDLTEAIALAHDIGHSPFGHCGERELNQLMKNEGGFDHNQQSLRWVEILETCYAGFEGLNLTWEVRGGLRKHEAHLPGACLDGHPIGPHQMLEAQVADLADDITYHAHDLDDGLDAGLISIEDLEGLELWQIARERALQRHGRLDREQLRFASVRALLDIQVEDVIHTAHERVEEFHPASIEEVMNCPMRIVDFSEGLREMLEPYRAFLFQRVYWHPDVAAANDEAVEMMRRLFLYYVRHPEHLGRKARARIPRFGLWRTVCDYISGMTDRYALEEFQRYGLSVR